MIIINLYDILNSLDNSLEKNYKSYINSFVDNFVDNLKERINSVNSIEQLQKLPKDTIFSLDRYEGNFGICENISTGEIFNIPKEKIDSCAKDGDILTFQEGVFKIDYTKTNERKSYIQNLTTDRFDR